MAVLNMVCGKSREKSPPLFTLSGGTYEYEQDVAADGTVNWELALLSGSSKTLTFQRVVDKVDVFICSGGQSGGTYGTQSGGKGGTGGGSATYTNISVSAGTSYTFTVGGSNSSSKIFGYTVATGGGKAGGNGADIPSAALAQSGTNGTAYAFGSSSTLIYSGRKYGGGGGGGGFRVGNNTYNGASGGASGGGHGGDDSHKGSSDRNGSANTGGGGGGGAYTWSGAFLSGGSGGSGIIIIRNHR